MSAPSNALVLRGTCPICDEDTIVCRYWSEWVDYYGCYEGNSEEEQLCGCALTEDELVSVSESAWENFLWRSWFGAGSI